MGSFSVKPVRIPCFLVRILNQYNYASSKVDSWAFHRDPKGNRTAELRLPAYVIPLTNNAATAQLLIRLQKWITHYDYYCLILWRCTFWHLHSLTVLTFVHNISQYHSCKMSVYDWIWAVWVLSEKVCVPNLKKCVYLELDSPKERHVRAVSNALSSYKIRFLQHKVHSIHVVEGDFCSSWSNQTNQSVLTNRSNQPIDILINSWLSQSISVIRSSHRQHALELLLCFLSPTIVMGFTLLARSLHSNHMSSSKKERGCETPD